MPWRRNRKALDLGFPDLAYLPRGRSDWDFTLASLAFSFRRRIQRGRADLNAWAARHALPASQRYAGLGDDAWVLWHGTSRARADKIAEHGLFSKGGLWATFDPHISHSFCRSRSENLGRDGAVICLVLDRREHVDGRDHERETEEIIRFHHGLPASAVEYILLGDQIRFTGAARADIRPWYQARFTRRGGRWVPIQKTPVRFAPDASYSTLDQFVRLTIGRLLEESPEITALEIFSTLYACISPHDVLEHQLILDLLDELCSPGRPRAHFRPLRRRSDLLASATVE